MEESDDGPFSKVDGKLLSCRIRWCLVELSATSSQYRLERNQLGFHFLQLSSQIRDILGMWIVESIDSHSNRGKAAVYGAIKISLDLIDGFVHCIYQRRIALNTRR